jgi:hypothetical protein
MAHIAPQIMDALQAAAWIVAAVGGLIAASKAIVEMRKATQQRQADLRWKQAEMAKTCIDELAGRPLARSAMKMLDWSGRSYQDVGRRTGPIEAEDRRIALRTEGTVFIAESDEQFIRDSFDDLFDGFERLEHFVFIGLICFEDIESAFEYYVDRIAEPQEYPVFEKFLTEYRFKLAIRFLERFPAWLNRKQRSVSV